MNAIAEELDALSALASRINRLPGPNSHAPGNWFHERDEIARSLARVVGRIRKELGLKDSGPLSFSAGQRDSGVTSVRQARAGDGRQIPVERRGRVPTRRELEAARTAL